MKRDWLWVLFSPVLSCLGAGQGAAMEPGIWKAELSNGMRVILVEDHSSALAASVICIRAGSRTETLSNSGITHLLEHLLFDGTWHRSREMLRTVVLSKGGYFNAFTRKDYTAFEIVMPSESFLNGLALQADQLINSNIPTAELAKERKVVCEEIAKDFNDPSSAAETGLMSLLFGEEGYGLPVLGTYHTVETVSREDIMRFYRNRYHPGQMTAVIVGDMDPREVLRKLRTLYESVPVGPVPMGKSSIPVFPVESRPVIRRADVRGETMRIAFPAPPLNSPEHLSFSIAVALWSEGKTSPLLAALTRGDTAPAADAGAWISDYDGFSLLEIGIEPAASDEPPETRARRLLELTTKSIDMFLKDGIDPERMKHVVKQMYVDHRFSMEKFHHRARDIAHFDALGATDGYFSFCRDLMRITPGEVQASAEKYLHGAAPVSVFVVPDPATGAPHRTAGTEPEMQTLSNGLRVIALYDPYAPMTAFHLLIPSVGRPDAGVPRFTAEMLDRGTRNMTAEQLEDALKKHGIRVKLADNPWFPFDDYYNSPEYNYLRMETLRDDAQAALHLLRVMAFESSFPDSELPEVQRKLAMIAGRDRKSAAAMSARAIEKMMFPDSIFSRPMIPDQDVLASITPERLRRYHRLAYTPGNCLLGIVGNIPVPEVFALAQRVLGDVPAGPKPPERQAYIPGMPHRLTIPAPSEQAYLRAAAVMPLAEAKALPVWDILARLLSDMLQEDIREQQGMAYRLGASTSPRKDYIVLEIGVGTRKTNADRVEKMVREIIRRFRKRSFGETEVKVAVNALKGHALRYRQRRINRAYYLLWRTFLGHGFKAETTYISDMEKITTQVLQKAAETLPAPDKWYWVLATAAGEKGGADASVGENP